MRGGLKMNFDGMDVINGYLSEIKKTVTSSGLDLDKYEVFTEVKINILRLRYQVSSERGLKMNIKYFEN